MVISVKQNHGKRLFFYVIAAFLCGFYEKGQILLYLCYFGCTAYDLAKYCIVKTTKAKYECLQNICLYALILPDNYACIVGTILCIFLSGHYKRKIASLECLLIIWVIGHILLGIAYLPHLLFSVFYWIVIAAGVMCGKRLFSSFDRRQSIHILKSFVLIEYIPVVIKALFFSGFSHSDMDWVYGTFGVQQGVQLFFVMSIAAIILLQEYILSGRKEDLLWSITAICLAVLTGSIAITLIYMAAVVMYIAINASWKERIIGISVVIAAFALLIFSNDSWVRNDILGLLNVDYLLYRVKKLQTFVATFITIPRENVLFSIWGEGLGRYSSRAALTMTGEYLGFVNIQSMSQSTGTYIFPQFMECKIQNIGTAAMPFSEICTIAGEIGIVGLLLSLMLFLQCYVRSCRFQKLLLLIIFLLCFYDNYLEFPKIALIVVFAYYRLMDEKGRIRKEKNGRTI